MNEFSSISELKIGNIVEVDGTSILVKIDENIVDLIKIYNGRAYPIGQISSIIRVNYGRKILFARVNMLRMKNDILDNEGKDIKVSDDTRILEADLFCEGLWNKASNALTFTNGVETYPLPLQSVYIMTQSELDILYESAEKSTDKDVYPYATIGKYVGSRQDCTINLDKLFGHHCAILGSTGSGKSGTVTSIIHSVLNYSYKEIHLLPNIILIDPHGEYGKPFENDANLYRAYSQMNGEDNHYKELLLPYWIMTCSELRELVIGKTEHEATSQNNVVYEAIGYAKMVRAGIVKAYGDNPKGQQDVEYCENKTFEDAIKFDRDKPIPFKWDDFILHIDKIQGRKPNTETPLSSSDRKDIDSILRKLKVLRSNPQLKFLMDNDLNSKTLESVLNQFLNEEPNSKHFSIIDISGVPNEVAGVLTAMISRLLFQFKLWESRQEREKNPVVLICEEAHRYVPNGGEAQYKEAQIAIRRIAKEGRKYGLGLVLVSQRPSDVESTVLSQCNSWIVLKLSNTNDQNYVSGFMPENNKSLIKGLSSLTRREAVLVGEAVALPCRIKVQELSQNQLPDSNDISFVRGWSNGAQHAEQKTEQQGSLISTVIARWVN